MSSDWFGFLHWYFEFCCVRYHYGFLSLVTTVRVSFFFFFFKDQLGFSANMVFSVMMVFSVLKGFGCVVCGRVWVFFLLQSS